MNLPPVIKDGKDNGLGINRTSGISCWSDTT
ncbi:unnamed protein product [Ectocarpus sp. CCAP 1310/34]|nr:unnamed protein product [Ectocarpus sp. CCAP 1310/34]